MRAVRKIAQEIEQTWPKVNYAARPYLDAMHSLDSIDDKYYLDTGSSIVVYFLSNASTWRGDDARRIKKELNDLVFSDSVAEQNVLIAESKIGQI